MIVMLWKTCYKQFPNYLYVFWIQCYGPALLGGILPLLYFLRHEPLRQAVVREVAYFRIRIFPSNQVVPAQELVQ